jgi:epoxyqueuosine reductase
MDQNEKAAIIKSLARDHGFLEVGFSVVRSLDEEKDRLDQWLSKGYHGDMEYMARNTSMRLNPVELVPGAQSVISLAYNYYTPAVHKPGTPKVSKYARGHDYHKVIKKKLKTLWRQIQSKVDTKSTGRYFVDSAPVMERQWAASAGLGWQGKNTLLIHPRHGSYFFLAEIICDIELPPDKPIWDHCGTCTRCIEACPTNAIDEKGYLLKADQCISYLTIETQKDIPVAQESNLESWLFGCDICQEVCPWNRFSSPHDEPLFNPGSEYPDWSMQDWQAMSEEKFIEHFGVTPLKRAGYKKISKTLNSINGRIEASKE